MHTRGYLDTLDAGGQIDQAGCPRRGAHRSRWQKLADMVDIAAVKRQLIADDPDLADVDEARIRDTFTDNPTRSWRSSAQHLVNEDIEAADGLTEVLRALLAEDLRKGGSR